MKLMSVIVQLKLITMNTRVTFVSIRDRVKTLLPAFAFLTTFFPAKFSFPQRKATAPVTVDAGFASVDITPGTPIRMAGYAARLSTEADSVLQPIAAKALALGSDEQHPSVLITVDLVGIPWHITKNVVDFLSKEKGIDPAQVAIYASHTHGGPELGNLVNILQYRNGNFVDSLLALDQLVHIARYTEQLTQKLKDVATAALKDRKPALISWGRGRPCLQPTAAPKAAR
jgi:hypothetical protein